MHSIAQSQVHNLQSQIQSLLQQQNVQVQAQTVHQNQNVSVNSCKNCLQEFKKKNVLGVAKFGSKRAKPCSEFRSKCGGAERGAKFSSKYGLAKFSGATEYESERFLAERGRSSFCSKCCLSKYDSGNRFLSFFFNLLNRYFLGGAKRSACASSIYANFRTQCSRVSTSAHANYTANFEGRILFFTFLD